MSRQVRRSLVLALAGLFGGLGLVLALFGGGDALRRLAGPPGPVAPSATAPAPEAPSLSGPVPRSGSEAAGRPDDAASPDARSADAKNPDAKNPDAKNPEANKPDAKPDGSGAGPAAPVAPSFDIVRVEPNGDAVVAGRGAPNTVVEMLVDGKPVARALADPSGQFAIVPPALPAGSSEIRLRTRSADGGETRSTQSVAVAISEGRNQKPLVALTAPDKATVVLSQPGAPEPEAKPGARVADDKAAPGKPQPARIVSVDAQEGGRLYVTGTGAPGTNLRLYLNDTLIAPGRVGPDGTVTFTIGRGVKPGQYQVRLDQIDPGTGRVRSRAEVPFAVPEPARIAAHEPSPAARPGDGHGSGAQADAKPGMAASGPGPQAAAEGRGTPGAAGREGTVTARAGTAHSARSEAASARPAPNAAADEGTPAAVGAPARAGAVFVPEISTARISRGDNLWRISQRTYGQGRRYTVIFDANQDQIRDPDLIYPGQIFVLPADKRG